MNDKKLNVKELIGNGLELGELGDQVVDYSNGYISDIISEIADNAVDIYTYNVLDWIKENYSIVEEANNEFGTDPDIIHQGQNAQYYYYSNDLYNNIEDILLNYSYNYIYYSLEMEYITEDQNEDIIALDFNKYSKLEELQAEIETIVLN